MGYRIIYGEDPFVKKKEKNHLRSLTAGFLLALVVLVRCCWPRGTEILRQTLLPGENTAFQQMTEQIRDGEPIGDAVTVFCQRIVEEALAQAS